MHPKIHYGNKVQFGKGISSLGYFITVSGPYILINQSAVTQYKPHKRVYESV